MLKLLFLRKQLKALMFEGYDVTIYANGLSCRGRVIEVHWCWCRIMVQDEGVYSSWLIALDSVDLVCDFSRNTEQLPTTKDDDGVIK